MTVNTDPYSLTEQALWFALDAHPSVSALVKRKADFTVDDAKPMLSELSDADIPEIALFPSQNAANQRNTSSSYGTTVTYTIAITTGDQRTTGDNYGRAGVHQVYWAIQKALKAYEGGIPDLPFVSRVWLTDANLGREPENGRAPDGWTCVGSIVVDFNFSKAEAV